MCFENEYVKTAYQIAEKAHAGQVDKGGNPYFEHPKYVAEHVDGWKEKCVGYLHDVIEDTEITAEDILAAGIPQEIVDAVRVMSHDKSEDYFEYVRRVRENPLARQVKLADLEHNSDTRRMGRELTDYDLQRLEKYKKAMEILK